MKPVIGNPVLVYWIDSTGMDGWVDSADYRAFKRMGSKPGGLLCYTQAIYDGEDGEFIYLYGSHSGGDERMGVLAIPKVAIRKLTVISRRVIIPEESD
ncbi:MAG: hypothetical protein L0Y56_19845 [Nitrospira sp.]|nr:hypothetical protein [Nitrospira sp.]